MRILAAWILFLLEARLTKHWLAFAWYERDAALCAALRACSVVELWRCRPFPVASALRPAGLATLWPAECLLCVKLSFRLCEDKWSITVNAIDRGIWHKNGEVLRC